MSLGWELLRRSKYTLDFYEDCRPPRKASRRKLIVSKKARTKFFLRCGYPLSEIEEAAAISLNYRNQMTVTKLLYPSLPQTVEDAAKDRFASSHESESGRRRIQRRHSNDSRNLSPNRTRRLSNDITPSRMYRRLSNEPSGALGLRMALPRRSSVGFTSPLPAHSSGAAHSDTKKTLHQIIRRYSNEPTARRTRRLSPGPRTKERQQRRNSPTVSSALPHSALLCPPSFATSSGTKDDPEDVLEEVKPYLRQNRWSNDTPRRGRRNQFREGKTTAGLGYSESNQTAQPLRLPTRTISPEQMTEPLVVLPDTLADMPSSLPIYEMMDMSNSISNDNEASYVDFSLMPHGAADSTEKCRMKSSEHTATTAASSIRISDESFSSSKSFSSSSSHTSVMVHSAPNSPKREGER